MGPWRHSLAAFVRHSSAPTGASCRRHSEGAPPRIIPTPSGGRVFIATGHTDMREGFDGLALAVQEWLKRDARGGQIFVFRGKRGDLIKVLWHDSCR